LIGSGIEQHKVIRKKHTIYQFAKIRKGTIENSPAPKFYDNSASGLYCLYVCGPNNTCECRC
jgi:hypothetical protein